MAKARLISFQRWHRLLLPSLAVLSAPLWLLQGLPAQAALPSSTSELSPHVSTNKLSASTRLLYTVKSNRLPFTLRGELLWRNTGDTYHARLRYSILGLTRTQTSHGRIGQTGLAPERFSDSYRGEVSARFNYTLGKVSFSANTPDAPLLAGAQDRLSVLIQLGVMLSSDPARYPIGCTVALPTVGPRDADTWLFRLVATEPLATPGGGLQGIRLERLLRQGDNQKMEVWLSPQLSYLPGRIRITEANGDSIDQQWQSTETADNAD